MLIPVHACSCFSCACLLLNGMIDLVLGTVNQMVNYRTTKVRGAKMGTLQAVTLPTGLTLAVGLTSKTRSCRNTAILRSVVR